MEALFTIQKAAAALAFSPRSVTRWICEGKIMAVQFGHEKRIHPDELDYIRRNGLREKLQVAGDKADINLPLDDVGICRSMRSRRKIEEPWLTA